MNEIELNLAYGEVYQRREMIRRAIRSVRHLIRRSIRLGEPHEERAHLYDTVEVLQDDMPALNAELARLRALIREAGL
jgi:lipopolysaccharide biosynthesis regulator YciM